MNHLNKKFDSFFSGEANVAVLKGEWGVGKTYFWENYISGRIAKSDLTQIAYSYISLFGKSSLDDVRKSVFHSAKPICEDVQIKKAFTKSYDESSKLFNKAPWLNEWADKTKKKVPFLSWVSKNAQHIPIIGKFSGLISTLEYYLVNNYIICFDDMERKGKALSVKEIMGLVDELAQRKDCKIVIIFNESSFDSPVDKDQFKIYREKVVDLEINHNPTCKENLSYVFPNDFECYNIIQDVVTELSLKNIRILRKIKWLFYDNFSVFFKDKNEQITGEFILHATILCWAYYTNDNDISYEFLKEQLINKSWLSVLSDEKDKIPLDEKNEMSLDEKKKLQLAQEKYSVIATNLKLNESVFDSYICFYLENGILEEITIKKDISKLEERIKDSAVSDRLTNAWKIYSESFSDNLEDFKTEIRSVLDEKIHRLGFSEFSSAVDILEKFGDDISQYIIRYLDCHPEDIKKFSNHPLMDMGMINNALKKEVEVLLDESTEYNIDNVSIKISENQAWDSKELEYLSSLSKEDYKKWMKSGPDKLNVKIKKGLFIFKGLGGTNASDNKKFNLITNNVIKALREISSENELNRIRVKNIYGIE